MYPRGWKKYCDSMKQKGFKPGENEARFAARYRLAKAFRHIEWHGISKATADGFETALKVSLAYNTLEALAKVTKAKPYEIEIIEQKLAKFIRSKASQKLCDFLICELDKRPADKIKEWLGNINDNNVSRIAMGIRHLTVHGILTSGGAGLTASKTLCNHLNQLAEAVLNACDRKFFAYYEGLR